MKKILSIIVLVSLAFAGEEKTISLKEVPAKLLTKVKKTLSDVKFTSANTEEENDYFVYEIQGTFPDKRKVEVDILHNSEIEEIEVEFPTYMVPKAVLIKIEKKYPGFKANYIEASHSESMKVVKYEFEGIYKNKKFDIEVSADGRKIIESDS